MSSTIIRYRYLVLIFLLSIFLRTYNLEKVPLGFSENEAAIGYNAYSILYTARDEEGNLFPLVFRSFGDYKSPLPVYLTIPSVAIFGLNIFSVRIVAGLFGILSVLLIYFVSKLLFNNPIIAVLSSFLLALSPWHVQISRFNTGTSLALFLFLIEMLIFLKNINTRKKLIGLIFIQTLLLLSHPSMWVLSLPLFIYVIAKEVKFLKRQKIIWLIVLALGFSLLGVLTKNNLKAFYLDQAFFNEIGFSNRINQLRGYSLDATGSTLPGKLIQNKIIILADQAFKNYLKGFDFYYLFSNNDNQDRFFVNAFGKFYSLELVFFFLGVYFLIKNPLKNKGYLFIILFLAPLPGIFNLRSNLGETLYLLLIPFYLTVSFGLWKLIKTLRSNIFSFFVLCPSFILTTVSATTFFHYYFNHYPIQALKDWSYGYQQIAEKVKKLSPQYDRIIISDGLARKPYIYTLFFQKIDPKYYQNIVKDRGGSAFISTTKFDKYEFRSIDWPKEVISRAFVVVPKEEIEKVCSQKLRACPNTIATIEFPDKINGFKLIEF